MEAAEQELAAAMAEERTEELREVRAAQEAAAEQRSADAAVFRRLEEQAAQQQRAMQQMAEAQARNSAA